MAASTSSSSSCQTAESKYDVFLSFRGEDTRENFTSHLFAALCRKKIKTFIDEDLKRGDEISPALLNAIEGSKISVIILSKDYASSKWCLDELVKILECKKKNGQIVIPVFYHVHPSDVRKQTRSFSEAFVKHEIFFKKMPGKVQKWRAALTEASYLAGHESLKIRPEAKLVDVIVKDILKKLEKLTVSTDSKGLIGISSQIERVKSLLCIGLQNFRILGIWGMGGIGKTTLAEAIFKQVSCDFEGNCFMANVREKTEKGGGLEHLQREVLSHLLEENLEKGGPNLPEYIKKRLQRMKVFIVLDDVNSLGQLEYLAGGLQFALGSRIIITTRDKEVLDKFRVDNIYKVEKLGDNEALELFRDYAFRQNHCPEDLTVLLEQVVDYAKGNPLALKVLGSYFHGKSKPDWEKALHNFHRISSPKIFDVLKISYDELNLEEKSLFLDIACFFNGEDKERVIEILDDPSMSYGLNILIDKSLVTVSQKYTLQIHGLLQEMGQEIVRQESVKELGRRSRLWYHEDVYHLLKKNKGTDKIEGIFLDMSKIGDLHLTSGAFEKMSNLRLLKFFIPEHFGVSHMSCNVHLSEGLKYLPDELRYLYWHGYPLRTLPLNFNPENLIELSLPCSKVQQLWEGKREAPKLKSIDLRHSHCLASIPDPSETPNVERINLLNCINLSCIPSSIQNFNNLALLCFTGCTSLSCFPSNIHFRSPIKINFFSCINLTEFPPISGNIIELDLRDTAIKEVSSSIKNLTNLENLNLSHCKKLTSLSTSICKLKSLRMLDLSWCSNFKSFPEILEEMESLECISLVSTKIKELPSSIELLKRLTELRLSSCSKLDSLPENLGNLKSLKLIDGEHTAVSQLPSSITNLNKLEKVTFNGCRGLVLPSLSGLSNLKEMRLNGCGIIEIPQDIGCLSTLEILDLKGNNFENLPTSIRKLSQLRNLDFRDCNMLQSLPELPLQLEFLDASNCKQLQSLPELPQCVELLDASLLETLSQRSHAFSSHTYSSARIQYIFNDCPKVSEKEKNILADSHLRIQHMAIASLKLFHFYQKEFGKQPGIDIYCLPGSRIPEWFSNQCSGSSITIQLPQHCCNRNFVGFALCVVFGFEDDSAASGRLLEVKCSYHFEIKTLSATEHFDYQTVWSNRSFIEWDHVLLGFLPCWSVRLPDGDHCTTVSFDFSISYVYSICQNLPKVKCCGVRLVYAHSNEYPPNTFIINMEPPTEEECRSGTFGSISRSLEKEEEVEPICKEQNIVPQQKNSLLSQIFRRRGGFFSFLIIVFLLFILSAVPHWKIGI